MKLLYNRRFYNIDKTESLTAQHDQVFRNFLLERINKIKDSNPGISPYHIFGELENLRYHPEYYVGPVPGDLRRNFAQFGDDDIVQEMSNWDSEYENSETDQQYNIVFFAEEDYRIKMNELMIFLRMNLDAQMMEGENIIDITVLDEDGYRDVANFHYDTDSYMYYNIKKYVTRNRRGTSGTLFDYNEHFVQIMERTILRRRDTYITWDLVQRAIHDSFNIYEKILLSLSYKNMMYAKGLHLSRKNLFRCTLCNTTRNYIIHPDAYITHLHSFRHVRNIGKLIIKFTEGKLDKYLVKIIFEYIALDVRCFMCACEHPHEYNISDI